VQSHENDKNNTGSIGGASNGTMHDNMGNIGSRNDSMPVDNNTVGNMNGTDHHMGNNANGTTMDGHTGSNSTMTHTNSTMT